MASLVLGAAGAIAGGFIGGPLGASIGWSLGSAAGGILSAKTTRVSQEGPRLNDLKVETSSYGQPIPKVFGRVSIAGNLIWSSDILETVTTSEQESGGKGGGGQVTVTTTYSYKEHLAVAICEGTIGGVRKIWANGKLIYNVGDAATAETVFASNSRADGIRFYLGDAAQLADPIIEAYEGAGNVPGYRNLAYAVLENFQLADFNNAIPNFEFEVLSSATTNYLTRLGSSNYLTTGSTYQTVFRDGVLDSTWLAWTTPGGAGSIRFDYRHRITDTNGNLYSDDLITGPVSSYNTAVDGSQPYGNWPNIWLRAPSALTTLRWINTITLAEASGFSPGQLYISWMWKAGDVAIAISFDKPTVNTLNLYLFGVDTAKDLPTPNPIASALVPSVGALAYQKMHPYFDGTYLWLAYTTLGFLQKYDLTLTLLGTWTFTPITSGTNARAVVVTGDKAFFGRGAQGTETACYVFQLNDDFTATQIDTDTINSNVESIYPYAGGLVVGFSDIIRIDGAITPVGPTLSSIVSALCLRAGLTAGEIDVTALTDTVTGYVVGKRGPLSQALQPLMSAYFFDALESDGKIKFVKRNGASLVTLSSDHMAARASGEEAPDLVTHSRRDDLELPVEAAVLFINDNSAYEQGAQYARRLTGQSDNHLSFELPLVMTDVQAKRIADTLIFDAWSARDSFSWRTDRKYAKYEAGDVVTIPLNATESLAVRITKRDDGANGVLAWEGEAVGDSTIYTQASSTQSAVVPNDTVASQGPTDVSLLDIPLLREQDDDYGMYVGVNSFSSGWTGATLYRSIDNGGSYAPVDGGSFVSEITAGAASTALATTAIFDRFDEVNSVTVKLVEGTLSSVTRDQVLNGANFALLGTEVIQFKTATLTAANTYTLSSLLRARCGTTYAVASHAIGDRFVLLDPATLRFVRQASTDVGAARLYKPVSSGNLLQDTVAESFTYVAENLECLPVAHLGGGRNAALDLIINWKRRTRMSPVWRDYVDAPLGESSESYEIDIMSGAVVKRTISASTNTATYTVAQQTTDFGSAQASIVVNVYQLSSRAGRGHVATATI